jgi:TRAP-type C4-dicarboxylate transport system permease small subunit
MDRLERAVTTGLDAIVTALFVVIILLTVLLVVLRYIFNTSLIGGNEAMEYLFIYTTAIGAATAVGRRDHISIRYFLDKLPGPFRTAFDILGLILVAGLNILIAVLSRNWITKVGSSESPVIRVPMGFIQASVPIGCLLAAAYCIAVIIRVLRQHRDGTDS